jgi:hypothetical protein
MISHSYQGNPWWAFIGLFCLFLLGHALWAVWGKRRAGFPVEAREVIALCIWFSAFIAVAVFQVLSHKW